MATPTGARHDSVEQRVRDIEDQLRKTTGLALRGGTAPGKLFSTTTGVAIPQTGAVLHIINMEVPPGKTKASIFAIATVYAINSTPAGNGGSLLVRAEIGTFVGNAFPEAVTPSTAGVASSRVAADFEGLTPGQVIEARVWAGTTAGNWAANAQNTAELAGTVSWW